MWRMHIWKFMHISRPFQILTGNENDMNTVDDVTDPYVPSIMIVDDNPANLDVLSVALKESGYRVRSAPSGKLALQSAFNDPSDLILLDIMMPEMDGYEICRRLKENEATKHIPVIFVTALDKDYDEETGLSMGAVDYITKPIRIPIVLARVNAHVQLKLYRDLLERRVRERTNDLERVNEALKEKGENLERTEERLSYQLQFLHEIINAIKAPIFSKDSEGLYAGCNAAFEEYMGLTISEILGKTVFDLWPAERAEVYRRKDQYLLENGGEQVYESRVRYADGSERDVSYHKSLFQGEDGDIGGIVGVMFDITDRKRAELAVRESERFAISTVNALDASIAILDETGDILSVNSSWRRFAAENAWEPLDLFEGVNYLAVCDAARGEDVRESAEFAAGIRRVIRGEAESYELEYPCHSPEKRRWFIGRVTRFFGEGPVRVVVSHTDITEIKLAEERILASLHEKEVLLKEIHHRVKNNMQVVSSLLGLQSAAITEGADIRGAFNDMQNRIKSMAIVHENLYHSEDFSRVDFREYIRSLVMNISHSFGIDGERIRVSIDVEDVALDMNAAVPCGLLLNELITNALKHAFPGGRKGELMISMHRIDGGAYRLAVKDDGPGLPDGLDSIAQSSLGLRLAKLLANQIGGELTVGSGPGAEFAVTFDPDRHDDDE
ncbi:MAG: response regulator [Chrysiogenales bacterium]|nr:MAG: response regulator [Chrysiogenales bacterium]